MNETNNLGEQPSAIIRCGYVAIIGRPNVGKSTLMNQLLHVKLSIVTPKPQTTRQRVLGILNEPGTQAIFLDTPGLIAPQYALQTAMMKIADQSMEAADVLLIMIDGTSKAESDFVQELFKTKLLHSDIPKILAINKVDRMAKPELLPMMDAYIKTGFFKEVIPISALENDGVEQMKQVLFKYLPLNPPFYPPDALTEQPERFFVAEIIREKIFLHYTQEVPYSTEVVIEEFKERERGKDLIRAIIIVERDSQKAILIGKKGEALKRIGETARKDIETFLDRQVFLELWVKVKEEWRSNDAMLRSLGYR